MTLGKCAQQAIIDKYKEKVTMIQDCRKLLGDDWPEITRLEKEAKDLEKVIVTELGINLSSIAFKN